MARGIKLDFGRIVMDGMVGVGSGGIQRVLWEQGNAVGAAGTGGAILLGLLGRGMFSDPSTQRIMDVVYHSGLAVAGWVGAEFLFLKPNGVAASMTPSVSGIGLRDDVSPGFPAQLPSPRSNGVTPRASYDGVNPATGERILGSKI